MAKDLAVPTKAKGHRLSIFAAEEGDNPEVKKLKERGMKVEKQAAESAKAKEAALKKVEEVKAMLVFMEGLIARPLAMLEMETKHALTATHLITRGISEKCAESVKVVSDPNDLQKIKDQETQIGEMQKQLKLTEALAADSSRLRGQLKTAQEEVEALKALKTQLKAAHEEQEVGVVRLKTVRDEHEAARIEGAKLKAQLKAAQEENEALKLDGVKLKTELSSAGEDSVNLKTQLINSVDDAAKLSAQLELVKTELDALKAMETQLKRVQEEHEVGVTRLKTVREEHEASKIEGAKFKAQLKSAEDEFANLKTQLSAAEAEGVELKAQFKFVEDEGTKLKAQLSVAEDENVKLKAQLARAQDKHESTNAESVNLIAQLKVVQDEAVAMKSEGAKLSDQLRMAQGETLALREQVAKSNALLKVAQEELSRTEGLCGKGDEKLLASKSELEAFRTEAAEEQEKLRTELEASKNSIRELNGTLSETRASREACGRELAQVKAAEQKLAAEIQRTNQEAKERREKELAILKHAQSFVALRALGFAGKEFSGEMFGLWRHVVAQEKIRRNEEDEKTLADVNKLRQELLVKEIKDLQTAPPEKLVAQVVQLKEELYARKEESSPFAELSKRAPSMWKSLGIVSEVTAPPEITKIGMSFRVMPPMPLIIKKVVPTEWADAVGIMGGDAILEVNGRQVASLDESSFKHEMTKRPLVLKIWRNAARAQEASSEK